MRKQHCIIYKWAFIISLSVMLYFQSLLLSSFRENLDVQHRETDIATTSPVSVVGQWETTSVNQKLNEYNKTTDVREQPPVLRGNEGIAKFKETRKSSQIVKGAFFLKNKYTDGYLQSENLLTVYPGRGRLGNQMFQIASVIGIADKFRYRPFISSTSFDIDSVFEVPKSSNIYVDLTKLKKYEETDVSTFEECDITRYSDMSVLHDIANWTVDGYLQSFKHFAHIKNDVRSLFTFKSSILEKARRFINNVETIRVGIHVRRGDFLSEYHRNLGRVTPDADYYKKAMDLYTSKYGNVTFYVFSNDIAWCKSHLQDFGHEVIFSTFNHPGYDLATMSLCDHMIISVGTFGWWGGWLAGGSVVYFNGYPKPGSVISKYFVKEDFYPPHWTGIT